MIKVRSVPQESGVHVIEVIFDEHNMWNDMKTLFDSVGYHCENIVMYKNAKEERCVTFEMAVSLESLGYIKENQNGS